MIVINVVAVCNLLPKITDMNDSRLFFFTCLVLSFAQNRLERMESSPGRIKILERTAAGPVG